MANENAQRASLQRQLDSMNRRIQDHPLNSEKFTRARALVKESSVEDRVEVSATLREQGLPGVGAQMRMLALGLASLARLNRKRLRLENMLSELDAGGPN
ncbi:MULTISPECIES: hypothetical protein [unclassified Arthrobacter]|uniref:hypothetical protein n=1 Tax=unclassified Arthrobacter TaxID=235627 RepID=UPI001E46E5E3|nr:MULTISPECIES: hypothetical protein [unclassified Arthrobacter]MCC9176817.1 hypothetical protein [Arthrobacter sp. zg-Y750]MDK1326475.1 hypothetical protein [Arthrobacter sp. zg-Y1143]